MCLRLGNQNYSVVQVVYLCRLNGILNRERRLTPTVRAGTTVFQRRLDQKCATIMFFVFHDDREVMLSPWGCSASRHIISFPQSRD